MKGMILPKADSSPQYSSCSQRSTWETIWRFRELLHTLVVRNLKVKYQRSILGLIWTLFNPMITVAVLILVFSYVLRIQLDHYWAFLISGFFVWNFIQQLMYHATTILSENATLSRSVAFPSEILILSASFAKLVEFLIEMTVVLLVLFIFHFQTLPSSVVLFPYLVLLQVLMATGLMFPLSILSVLYHDIQHALPIMITTLFYLSPVFYPVSFIPDVARPFYYLNPIVGLLKLYRVAFYEGSWPPWLLLGSVSAVAFATFFIGYFLFKRYREICVEIA